jgi:hypothetical protein
VQCTLFLLLVEVPWAFVVDVAVMRVECVQSGTNSSYISQLTYIIKYIQEQV